MAKVFGYETYSFTDYDPILDQVRTAIKDSKLPIGAIVNKSGVTHATLSNWDRKKVRRPQYATVAAVLKACGYHLVVAKVGEAK